MALKPSGAREFLHPTPYGRFKPAYAEKSWRVYYMRLNFCPLRPRQSTIGERRLGPVRVPPETCAQTDRPALGTKDTSATARTRFGLSDGPCCRHAAAGPVGRLM